MTTSTEDFAALLEQSLQEAKPERGDIVKGTILATDFQGLLVDIGMKGDGIVPWSDLEKLDEVPQFAVGDSVQVMILSNDHDEYLVVSISQAKQLEDWTHAEALMKSKELWHGEVINANRGGVIVAFGHLQGFIPASHVVGLPRDLNDDDRKYEMRRLIGKKIACKVLEVDRKRHRLVLSEREAHREQREQRKDSLIDQLKEGDVLTGTVSGMRDFGAFVDLGGADGLVHISELGWQRVNHPSDVVSLRQKLEVYVLRLDRESKRIELSLKRLQPNPWAAIEEKYHIGQLVTGDITRVAEFGAFVILEPGVEGLLHSNQLQEAVSTPLTERLKIGEKLLLRVVSIDAEQQRLGLSLRDVTPDEWATWQAAQLDPGDSSESSLESLPDSTDIERVK